MTYKTILVHLNDSPPRERCWSPRHRCMPFNAHLIRSACVFHEIASPIPMASSALGSIVAAERWNNEAIADTFKRMTSGQPYVAGGSCRKVFRISVWPVW